MIVNTGFGYYVKNGKKLHKYELPKGYHPDPVGYEVVEVFDQASLDTIILDKSDAQLQAETLDAQRTFHKNAGLTKLKSLGLLPEEINALIS